MSTLVDSDSDIEHCRDIAKERTLPANRVEITLVRLSKIDSQDLRHLNLRSAVAPQLRTQSKSKQRRPKLASPDWSGAKASPQQRDAKTGPAQNRGSKFHQTSQHYPSMVFLFTKFRN